MAINIKSNNIAVGTYSFDATLTTNNASVTTAAGMKTAKSGSVTITSISAGVNIVGTFNFTCTDGTVVTNGAFNAKIQ